jgi:UDP-glucose/GDP-mannose dehydrogenase family, NAD binding domain
VAARWAPTGPRRHRDIRGLTPTTEVRLIHCRPMKIGIIGLGYVGLPLTSAFAETAAKVVDTDPRDIDSSQKVDG